MRQREMGRGGPIVRLEARNGRLRWPPEVQDRERQGLGERHTCTHTHTHDKQKEMQNVRDSLRLRKTQLKIERSP